MKYKTFKNQARQGDVAFAKVDVDLSKFEKVQPAENRTVLAYGEITGHAHAFPTTTDVVMYLDKATNTTYIHVLNKSILQHEEHTAFEFEPGVYEVCVAQEEIDNIVRRVTD